MYTQMVLNIRQVVEEETRKANFKYLKEIDERIKQLDKIIKELKELLGDDENK